MCGAALTVGMSTSTIGAKVDDEFKRKARVKAAMEDKSMSELVKEALERELEGFEIPE